MTSIASPTVQTAPRDFEALKRMGRFGLRQLAQQLDIISAGEDDASVARKTSFMGMNTEQQAQAILTALAAVDAGGGQPAPVAAPTQTAPAPTNGAANGEAKPSGLRRTPVNKTTETPQQTSAPAATQPAPQSVMDLSPFMKGLEQSLKNEATLMANMVELFSRFDALKTQLGVATSAILLVGERTLEADRQEILTAAIEDTQAVLDLVMGKGKK
jgi:hypothetical protein